MLQTIHTNLSNFNSKVNFILQVFLGTIVFVMCASIILQVVSRYFFNNPLPWPEEVTMFLMAWLTFIGSGIALRSWEHIGIDFFLAKFSVRNQALMYIFIRLIVLSFCVFLLFEGYNYAAGSMLVSDGLRIPLFWPRLAMPIGGAVMTLFTLEFLLKDILKYTNKESNHGG